MSFLAPKAPTIQPQPLPQSPSANNNAAAEKARQDAETAAVAESKAGGRRSTIVAGMKIAEDAQSQVGLLAQKRRGAVSDLG